MTMALRSFTGRLLRFLLCLVLTFISPTLVPAAPVARGVAAVEIWRLDCGGFDVDASKSSDTFDYEGQRRVFVDSCYLIKHCDQFMLWDTGLPVTLPKSWRDYGALAPKRSILNQLAEINIKPKQVGLIGISHWQPDHMSQAADFPEAKLMMGTQDWELFKSINSRTNLGIMQPWLSGNAPVERVEKDKDIFGDGSVVMLSTPGHTAGHHSLMVRLSSGRTVLLSGDLSNLHASYDRNLVQDENVNRADTLASFARIKAIARRFHATVIIQHDAGDVGKLPSFPSSAQ